MKIKITDSKTFSDYKAFISRIESFNNFDNQQEMTIYLSHNDNLIAFESKKYTVSFKPYTTKISDIDISKTISMTYNDMKAIIELSQ